MTYETLRRFESSKRTAKARGKGGVNEHQFRFTSRLQTTELASEAVKSPALSLQRIHDIHCGHSLAPGVLSVGHSITNDVLQKDFQHTASLLVDQTADALHAASPSQAPDGGLGDPLNVITQNLSMTLRATLAEPLPSLAASRHGSRTRSTHHSIQRQSAKRHENGEQETEIDEADNHETLTKILAKYDLASP